MAPVVSIPRHPADVTAEWLGAVLDAEVRAVDVVPIGTGQTGATYRLAVTYARPCELPATFAIKLSSQDDTVRDRVALGYRSEHAFYTGVADHVRIPIPSSHHCEISDDGGDFVLLLADMAPAVQGDQIGGCTPAEAELGRPRPRRPARAHLVRPARGPTSPGWRCRCQMPTPPRALVTSR